MIKLFEANLRTRISVKMIIFFIAGIFIFSIYGFKITAITAVALFLSSVIFSFFLSKRKSLTMVLLVIYILSLIAGAFHINYTDNNRQIDLRNKIGKKGWVYGTVISNPELTNSGRYYSIIVDINKIEYKNTQEKLSGKMCLYVNDWKKTAPVLGEHIYFFTEFIKPDFKENSFDFELYLKSKDIYATGFTYNIYPDLAFIPSGNPFYMIKSYGRKINTFFRNRIETVFSYDADACAITKGILLGDKTDFSTELSENFSKAGISHITAVSGLHLNILFGALCGLLGFFRVRKKIVAGIILPVILLFSAITDFSPSICRAAIMLTIHMFALLTKRQYDPLTSLFVSALIILVFNPYSIFNVSFILSFAATLSIIILYPKTYEIIGYLGNKIKIPNYILVSFAISIASFIGTAPIIAYYFKRISIALFITNIWIIPLCSVIFILGYISCVASLFVTNPLLNIILYPLATCLEVIILTTNFTSKISFLSPQTPSFSAYYLYLYYGCLALISVIIKAHRKSVCQ